MPDASLTADHLRAQLAADLRALVPTDTDLLIAGCFEDGAGGFNYRGTAVSGITTGQPAAHDLPELPATAQGLFRQLRTAMSNDPDISSLWEICKVQVLCRPDEAGQDKDQEPAAQFFYGFPERAGQPDNDEAYDLPTAAELQAAFAGAEAGEETAKADDYAAPAARPAPATAPKASARPTMWVCTWCHEEYTSERQPTSFQPDKCARNPGKAHAWHKQ